jgi:hypothetical protein
MQACIFEQSLGQIGRQGRQAYKLVEVSSGVSKIERFLPKNQHRFSKDIIEF